MGGEHIQLTQTPDHYVQVGCSLQRVPFSRGSSPGPSGKTPRAGELAEVQHQVVGIVTQGQDLQRSHPPGPGEETPRRCRAGDPRQGSRPLTAASSFLWRHSRLCSFCVLAAESPGSPSERFPKKAGAAA